MAAREALLAIANEPDPFERERALGGITTRLFTLEREGELARAAAFARYAYETLAPLAVGGERAFLPVANAQAKYCSLTGDLACLDVASRKAIELIGGIPAQSPGGEEAAALEWRAVALVLAGDVAAAKPYLVPLSYAVEPDADHEIADQIASIVTVRGDFSGDFAIRLRRAALGLLDEEDRRERPFIVANIATALGADCLGAGRLGEAEAAWRTAYEIALENYPPDAIATTMSARNLATVLVLRGRRDLALPLFRRNWEIAREAQAWEADYGSEVRDWITALIEAGRTSEALETSAMVWEEARAAQAIEDAVLAQYGIARGEALEAAGDFAEAVDVLREAARLADGAQRLGAPEIARLLALSIEGQDRWAEAEAFRREAYSYAAGDLLEGAFSANRVWAGLALARNLSMQGRSAEAERLFTEMLELAKARSDPARIAEGDAALGLARHFIGQDDPARALGFARTALDIRASQLARLAPGAGESAFLAAARGQRRAARLAVQALLASGAEDADALAEMFAAAQRADTSAASIALSTRAASALARAAGAGEAVDDWRAAQGRLDAIDARLLALENAGAESSAGDRSALYEERQAALADFARIEGELREGFPAFFDLARPAPAELDAIRAVLGEGEALVLLVPGDSESQDAGFGGAVIALTRDEAAAARIALAPGELADLTRKLHRGLAEPGSGYTDQPGFLPPEVRYSRADAHRLYQALFADPRIAAVLEPARRWTIVPQGELVSVSFEALVTAPPPGGEDSDADPAALRATRWLGMERALAIAPSVASIALARMETPRGWGRAPAPFLGIGDPAFDGEPDPPVTLPDDLRERGLLAAVRAPGASKGYFRGPVADLEALAGLERLPGTALEIRTLAAVLGAGEDSVLTQLAATEANVTALSEEGRLGGAELVVFATHGLIAGDAGDGLAEPALALTPPPGASQDALEPGNDGLLTASEAAALKIAADWLILSACNTAAGSGSGAQGLSGLARGFLYAGARSLLVSHFPVSDRATPRLTSTAVTLRREEGLGRAEAMREARRRMLADTSDDAGGASLAHPKAWAALTLIAPGA
ncbi:CHAT domain-containing protein [Erythrobacter sp.]|uniref:CHAT domain-containing protein n=1 Tax=Erythrobacter sp. TaxID=1042 RepID=UPI001425C4F8|nr:CHAT domain-containing protein [Erythrobacter sp.]QIQ87227.1 MAG: CHAT domain-containing protein [Erythrobacter sp.]